MAEGGVGLNTSPFPSIGTAAAPHVIVTFVFPYELPLIQPPYGPTEGLGGGSGLHINAGVRGWPYGPIKE